MVTARSELMAKAKAGVKKAFSQKDVLLIQAVRSLTDVDEAVALLHTRLDEWFRLNYPEFEAQDSEKAAAWIAAFGDKEHAAKGESEKILGPELGARVVAKAKTSYGAEFSSEDREAVQTLALAVKNLVETRHRSEKYIDSLAKQIIPNLSTLVEPSVASKLVTEAGGLSRLAEMPSSTIQVIGAEKALFKHLRSHTKPPKHGIIFHASVIRSAPLEQRGRIARALAGKLAIAAKADYYTRHFIADKLKADLDARFAQIREEPKG